MLIMYMHDPQYSTIHGCYSHLRNTCNKAISSLIILRHSRKTWPAFPRIFSNGPQQIITDYTSQVLVFLFKYIQTFGDWIFTLREIAFVPSAKSPPKYVLTLTSVEPNGDECMYYSSVCVSYEKSVKILCCWFRNVAFEWQYRSPLTIKAYSVLKGKLYFFAYCIVWN